MSATFNLDPAALQRLHRLGVDAFVVKMIGLFLDYTRTKIADAQTARAAGNLRGVELAVHPLKSSAGNIGAIRIQELAQRLEELARQGRGETLIPLLEELEQAFTGIEPELEDEKAGAVLPASNRSRNDAPMPG